MGQTSQILYFLVTFCVKNQGYCFIILLCFEIAGKHKSVYAGQVINLKHDCEEDNWIALQDKSM